MLAVSNAQQVVLQHAQVLPPQIAPLSSSSLGLVSAEDVASDLDMPPYDKAMMDGYAARVEDLARGKVTLVVVEEVAAGKTPQRDVSSGQATRIMTGAPIPKGANAVVMVERTRMVDDRRVEIDDRAQPGQNILPRGQEMKNREVVLEAGARLRPQEFGLLAAVGKTAVKVYPAARVSILTTGDEVVESYQTPGPGQIRNSNGPMLLAQVCRAGGVPKSLGIGRDNVEHLKSLVAEGLQADILLLSGGVSAGKADLVPGVLKELGVQIHFHKVKMKPGKPVLFGSRGRTLAFGLPGNPVSSMVCFELFVRPAIRKLQNDHQVLPPLWQAALSEEHAYRTDRPTYHPACVGWKRGQYEVKIVPWFGSADLRGLTKANALAVLPAGEHRFQVGQLVDVLPMDYV